LVAAPGCGDDDGRVNVYPVSGRVLVKGQPADGAQVAFYPTAAELQGPKMPVPAATTDANGVFRLQSYELEDGAPAGEFKVTVAWPAPPAPNASGVFDLKDRLGGRYSNPQTSKLTARVEEGGGEIPPFELQ
jgi:hypothetical protein